MVIKIKTLRQLRKERCMRVQQIAYDLGVTDRTYYLWENHSISPSLEKALRVAAYFDVKVEDIDWGFQAS